MFSLLDHEVELKHGSSSVGLCFGMKYAVASAVAGAAALNRAT